MHGAGGPLGRENGNYRNGGRTKQMQDTVRSINAMVRFARVHELNEPDNIRQHLKR
jgi:hypothetical protein